MTKRLAAVVAALLLGAGSAIAGCSTEEGSQYSDAQAQRYAFKAMGSALRNTHSAPGPYDNLSELLPNQLYDAPSDGEPAKSITAAVVSGDVVEVAQGYGYYVPGDDAPGGTQIPFDDDRAEWRTVTATVEVDNVLGSADGAVVGNELAQSVGNTVEVSLPLYQGTDFGIYKAGLESIDSAVFFLGVAPAQPNEDGHFIIRANNLLAPIVDGALTLPAVDPELATDLLDGSSTLADLEQAAEVGETVTEVRAGSPDSIVLAEPES